MRCGAYSAHIREVTGSPRLRCPQLAWVLALLAGCSSISGPYSPRETLDWIANSLFGPSSKYAELSEFIPHTVVLNEIEPALTLGFFGDVMQMKGKRLDFGRDLVGFFAEADYLVGNFEGVVTTTPGGPMASVQTEAVLEALGRLFPPGRTVLTNANNHSCDFGGAELAESLRIQKEHGYLTIGARQEPAVLLDGRINVVSVTEWSNRPCDHLARLEDAAAARDPNAMLNVLSPHWGYEMQLYPTPEQIERGNSLLGMWDLIVGHHTHYPQVITAYDIGPMRKLLAYSLGDFCTYLPIEKYLQGIVLRVEVGPAEDGVWRVGRVDWRCSSIDQGDDEVTRVDLADRCRHFEAPEGARSEPE